MRKIVVILVIFLLFLLAACAENDITAAEFVGVRVV